MAVAQCCWLPRPDLIPACSCLEAPAALTGLLLGGSYPLLVTLRGKGGSLEAETEGRLVPDAVLTAEEH